MCFVLFFIFLLSIICGPRTHYDSCGNLSLCKPPNCSRYEVSCGYFQSWTKGSIVRNTMDSVLGAWQSCPPQNNRKKIHRKYEYVKLPLLLFKQYPHCYGFSYLGYYFVFFPKYENDCNVSLQWKTAYLAFELLLKLMVCFYQNEMNVLVWLLLVDFTYFQARSFKNIYINI